jgi:glyoxylase-like metal-dependent hydrolase (beta-lactamase superfamily II)
MGATVIAHPRSRAHMLAEQRITELDPPIVVPPYRRGGLPVVTLDEPAVIAFNGEEIAVIHVPAAHSDGDLAYYFRTANVLFTGDLIIWQAPNCGNPQKVQRYPEDWADALDAMAGLDAEWLFPGHGLVIHGAAAIRTVLTESARYLRVIVDQVRARMNDGQTPEEIFHAVEPDAELSKPFHLRDLIATVARAIAARATR